MFLKGNASICPQCGWKEGTMPNSPQHLPPGTILHNKYVIGKVLGQGGFGITYLGWDIHLEMKLAVKEYMPKDFATRNTGYQQVTFFSGDYKTHFEHGLKKFLDEAKILAKYSNQPGIVSVRDFFEENGTAYLVMYYLDGIDLKRYLEQLGGKLPYEQAIHILMPVMDALKEIHKDGLLHRDISPDNIYVTTDGEIKLLDFGAARHAFNDNNRSLSVILKPGYAPEEQYRSKGRQGPWTDVYAVAATFYRMIVGQIPPESLDRLEVDTLIKPSSLGVPLPIHVENALIKALSLKGQDRYQSIGDFQQDLLNQQQNATVILPHSQQQFQQTYQPQTTQASFQTNFQPVTNQGNVQGRPKTRKKRLLVGFVIGGVIISTIFAIVIGAMLLLPDKNVTVKIPRSNENNPIEEKVTPPNNTPKETPNNETVAVKVPLLYNLTEAEAVASLQAAGLTANVIREENLITYPGRVFNQGVEPNTEIQSNSLVDLYINSGVPLPVDVNTIYTKQMDIIYDVWNEASDLYNEDDLEGALRKFIQAQAMATELYAYNGDLDAMYAQAYLLSEMGSVKGELAYHYYAVESSRDAVTLMEELVSIDTEEIYDVWLGTVYGNLAWQQLLNLQPEDALASTLPAVIYDPENNLIQINMAHAYLLSGGFENAQALYEELWVIEENGYKLSTIILFDFDELISAGYPSEDIEEMRALLTGN